MRPNSGVREEYLSIERFYAAQCYVLVFKHVFILYIQTFGPSKDISYPVTFGNREISQITCAYTLLVRNLLSLYAIIDVRPTAPAHS